MTFANLMTRQVTILRAGTKTDRYNSVIADWAHATETTVGGWLAPIAAQTEALDDRDRSDATSTLFLPAGTDVRPANRVRIDGLTYQVTGAPSSAQTPRGEHHIEVQLALVEG